MLDSKPCFKCGETKSLSDFYKHNRMSDGHLNKCKECCKKDVANNRRAREDYYKAYDRNRPNALERSRKNYERVRNNSEKWNKIKENRELWIKNNPFKRFCQLAVGRALKNGTLKKTCCFICGNEIVEGHHSFYDTNSPLDVTWLCVKHHEEVHRKYDHNRDLKILDKAHPF